MSVTNRILVDKEKIEKDGIVYYRLYLFDPLDGKTIVYDSPVFVSKNMLKSSDLQNMPNIVKNKKELK